MMRMTISRSWEAWRASRSRRTQEGPETGHLYGGELTKRDAA
jgi:hypothetical protein